MNMPVNRANKSILVLMAVFLNQSSVILGVNLSAADLFFALTLFLLLINDRFKIPRYAVLFFLTLTIFLFYTSLNHVPRQFLYYPSPGSVISNYIKLLVVFLYFAVGCNLSDEENKIIVKWYSRAAAVIGVFGSLLAVTRINVISSALLYGGLRLRGFMNDPNYFSIIQNSAIAYYSRLKNMKQAVSASIVAALAFSILASGSKTGIITLLGYIIYRVVEAHFKIRFTLKALIAYILLLIYAFVIILPLADIFSFMLGSLSDRLLPFSRIKLLFTDFESAVSGVESNRELTWEVALGLIEQSPVLGIGVGTYSGLAKKLYNTPLIAHNTYLQLLSEWGIILAVTLFIYLFFIIGRVIFINSKYRGTTIILKDMLLIFMIGSMAISFNNARMFWLFFGMLANCTHSLY